MARLAPQLRPLSEVPEALLRGLPPLPREGVELFLVTGEGVFGERSFGIGEVLVCRGDARSDDVTVLVARGHGRPRLGRVRGARLIGDGGEPCLPERWRPAGRLVARYRHGAHGWVVELVEPEAVHRTAIGGDAPVLAPASAPAQLSLFAA